MKYSDFIFIFRVTMFMCNGTVTAETPIVLESNVVLFTVRETIGGIIKNLVTTLRDGEEWEHQLKQLYGHCCNKLTATQCKTQK